MKEEKKSLPDINSVARPRYEKAIKTRFASALLRGAIVYRDERKETLVNLINDPSRRGATTEGQEGPEKQNMHFTWAVDCSI